MSKLRDFILSNKVFSKCSKQEQEEIISELEKVEHLDDAFYLLNKAFDLCNEAFDLFIEWATDNDFGYDNLGDLYEQYKEKIYCWSYNYGLKYIALKEAKKKMDYETSRV